METFRSELTIRISESPEKSSPWPLALMKPVLFLNKFHIHGHHQVALQCSPRHIFQHETIFIRESNIYSRKLEINLKTLYRNQRVQVF